ncbi:MAG: riboflavin biosynthesis protein RibF [Bacteroidaceae bacterium]|nr:riboflavin biosynthesis protein RibF [Bacteroidaceae bacterium]
MKVATIGFFDGVHKGHQFLIRQVVEEAERIGGTSVCVTFANHPRSVVEQMKHERMEVRGDRLEIKLLTTQDEKVKLLKQMGIQEVSLLEFTPEIAMMSAYDFMKQVLKQKMDVGVLVIGYDHRFGHNRSEGFDDYVRYGKEIGIQIVQAKAYAENHITVSSSLIRETLLQGSVAESRKLLGYDYFLEGIVVNGFKVGRRIGYPTANIEVAPDKLIPCDGVYAVRVEVRGERLEVRGEKLEVRGEIEGMLNIGWRPTFNGNKRTIEVNLFDFEGNIYSEHITIHFVDFLRPEQRFASPEALTQQLAIDEQKAREILND